MLLNAALAFGSLFGSGAVLTLFGWALAKWLARDAPKIYAITRRATILRRELLGTLSFLTAFSLVGALAIAAVRAELFFPFRFSREIHAELVTFFGCWWGIQAYSYGLHRALHLKALFRFHAWHHESRVTSPTSAFSLHPVEAFAWALGLVGFPLLFACLGLLAPVGLLAFFVLIWIGNIIEHENSETLPTLFTNRWLSLLENPVTYHALHHARHTGNFGFGTALCDRAARTEFSDWREVHARVLSGHPLT